MIYKTEKKRRLEELLRKFFLKIILTNELASLGCEIENVNRDKFGNLTKQCLSQHKNFFATNINVASSLLFVEASEFFAPFHQ